MSLRDMMESLDVFNDYIISTRDNASSISFYERAVRVNTCIPVNGEKDVEYLVSLGWETINDDFCMWVNYDCL